MQCPSVLGNHMKYNIGFYVKKLLNYWVLLIYLITTPFVAFATDFSNIVIFGDSLSDNGNLYAQTKKLVPDARQYYQGRFSNGLVWVEYLADKLQIYGSLYNYAHGGASTDSLAPPGLFSQINSFLVKQPFSTDMKSNSLVIIWIGANDFLIYNKKDYTSSSENIAQCLEALAVQGFSNILVLNLPNLGDIPKMNKSQSSSSDYEERAIFFNNELEDTISNFKDQYPYTAIYFFNVFSIFEDIVDNPQKYGFANAADVCPGFYINENYDNDGRYLFWDDVHPTTEAHMLLASKVAAIFGADIPDGNLAPIGNRDYVVSVGDALVALRFSLSLEMPTEEDLCHGDVAPLDSFGRPCPDGDITVGDALVILRKALGIIDF